MARFGAEKEQLSSAVSHLVTTRFAFAAFQLTSKALGVTIFNGYFTKLLFTIAKEI